MNLFDFLLKFGAFHITFGFPWTIISFPFILLFTLIRFEKAPVLLKAIGVYFMVSLYAALTLKTCGNNILLLLVSAAFTCLVMLVTYCDNLNEAHKQRMDSHDFMEQMRNKVQIQEEMPYETAIMYGQCGLYLAALFVPGIINNPVNHFVFKVFYAAASIPILSWLVGGWGLLTISGLLAKFFFGLWYMMQTSTESATKAKAESIESPVEAEEYLAGTP